MNPAFTRVLGYSEAYFLSHPYLEFVHPDDRAATMRIMTEVATGHASPYFENRYRCADGEYRWMAWSSSAAAAVDGLFYAVARDRRIHPRHLPHVPGSEFSGAAGCGCLAPACYPSRMLPAFESKSQPPLSRIAFWFRFLRYLAFALGLLVFSLGIGMTGYHNLESMTWLDAFLNASMILGGMGPVDVVKTEGGKLFAGFYALFSGIVVLAVAGILFSPLVHRLLHKFHFENDGGRNNPE